MHRQRDTQPHQYIQTQQFVGAHFTMRSPFHIQHKKVKSEQFVYSRGLHWWHRCRNKHIAVAAAVTVDTTSMSKGKQYIVHVYVSTWKSRGGTERLKKSSTFIRYYCFDTFLLSPGIGTAVGCVCVQPRQIFLLWSSMHTKYIFHVVIFERIILLKFGFLNSICYRRHHKTVHNRVDVLRLTQQKYKRKNTMRALT